MHGGSIWRRSNPARERLRNWPPSIEITTSTRYLAATTPIFTITLDPRCNNFRRRGCIPDYYKNKCRVVFNQVSCAYSIEWGDADARWGSLFIGCHAFHAPFLHSMVACSYIVNHRCTIVSNVGNECLSKSSHVVVSVHISHSQQCGIYENRHSFHLRYSNCAASQVHC